MFTPYIFVVITDGFGFTNLACVFLFLPHFFLYFFPSLNFIEGFFCCCSPFHFFPLYQLEGYTLYVYYSSYSRYFNVYLIKRNVQYKDLKTF